MSIKVTSKPRTLLIAPSNNYIKIIMYRLFTFQKLRGHSKTTWTKRGPNVPCTSVGNKSKVNFCPRSCLKMSLYGYAGPKKTQTIVRVGFECPLTCTVHQIWQRIPNFVSWIICLMFTEICKNEIRNSLSNPVNKLVPYIWKF